MSIFQSESTLLITCAPDVKEITEKEIIRLGYTIVQSSPSGIQIKGNATDGMRLCMYLRTASKVLYLVSRGEANNPDEMYKFIHAIEWDKYFTIQSYFSIESFVQQDTIKDSRFANQKCKDAIVDYFNKLTGKRPNTGGDKDKAVLFLFWKQTEVAIYIDLSGEPITKHGYRIHPWKAPMIETLAAAVIMTTKWDQVSHFINPMCGSGTLAIEAALIASGKPNGHIRRNYGFMHIKGFDIRNWYELKDQALKYMIPSLPFSILASDISEEAIQAAKENAKKAGVENLIEFSVQDFRQVAVPRPRGNGGIIIMNPEYGERLGEEEKLMETYKEIGDFFKKKGTGYTGYIFTGNMELAKHIGLRTSKKIIFHNARIECRLLEFELYEGKKVVKARE
jgi:putative N6-adenine-specific DNA methylase